MSEADPWADWPPLAVGQVWRDVDPRFPRRRVEILTDADEDGWLIVVPVTSDGRRQDSLRSKELDSLFWPLGSYRPDDSGLAPVTGTAAWEGDPEPVEPRRFRRAQRR